MYCSIIKKVKTLFSDMAKTRRNKEAVKLRSKRRRKEKRQRYMYIKTQYVFYFVQRQS